MSKSIRLNDELFEDAKQAGLSSPAQKNAGVWGNKSDIDGLISEVTSKEGRQRARAVISKNSKPRTTKNRQASSDKTIP